MKILVTGATGNVGNVILGKLDSPETERYAGVRDIERARQRLGDDVQYCEIDFAQATYPDIQFDAVFLMRPPQVADPEIFRAYLKTLDPNTRIVFLSVQGADRQSYLPHAKIEKVIAELGFEHVFLRPSYFMENLTTTLWEELEANHRIYLPSGGLKLNWIAIDDIAAVAAMALQEGLDQEAVEICSDEILGFEAVIEQINDICGTSLTYQSPWVLSYVINRLRQGTAFSYVLIMLLLHYLPRFRKNSPCDGTNIRRFLGRDPQSLADFITENRSTFEQLK